MRRIIIMLIAIGVLAPAGLDASDYRQGYSSSYALVVGVDKYRHWPNLEYAVKDAREMAALLTSRGFELQMLIDENATRSNFLQKLETIKKSADVNSRVVIYFAGHGQTEDLPGGRERGYILPVDADAFNWQDTMLDMKQLNQNVRQIKAKHIFLAFDACYSGLGLARSIKRQPEQDSAYIIKMMQSRSIQILTAGSRSEQAIEAEGHGLFTEHLLAALSGTADINADGYITGTEIYATLRPSVTQQSHSRQTPQFGYIEGNGDLIFYNRPRNTENAAVIINSHIDGINVWANSVEIGRRLPTRRHRLAAIAGQAIIIVKKGGQTLYRRRVLLQANREFLVQLPAATDTPQNRLPFSMLTIAHPDIENYSNAIAYDLDADGKEEIIAASDNRLYALKPDGSIFWKKEFNFPIVLNLIDHWNNQTAIGISAIKNKKVLLILLNSRGEIIWRRNGNVTPRHPVKTAVRQKIAQLADIDQDGYGDVLAIGDDGSALSPHSLILYDRHGRELWRYATGPLLQNIVIWPKKGGRPDIIIGTFSSGDESQNELHTETKARQAYVISIDGYGRTKWAIRMGGYYTGVRVLLANLEGVETQALYAHKYTAYKYRTDEGGLYRISRSGRILNGFETDNSILSVVAGTSGVTSEKHFYAVDKKNNLFKLDSKLKVLQKTSLNQNSASGEWRLVGLHDYDGDGVDDILMYSFDRLIYTRNPISESGAKNKKFYSNLKFQILSQNFSKLIKRVSIGDEWEERSGFVVKDLDRPNAPYFAFMALSDKVMVYNY